MSTTSRISKQFWDSCRNWSSRKTRHGVIICIVRTNCTYDNDCSANMDEWETWKWIAYTRPNVSPSLRSPPCPFPPSFASEVQSTLALSYRFVAESFRLYRVGQLTLMSNYPSLPSSRSIIVEVLYSEESSLPAPMSEKSASRDRPLVKKTIMSSRGVMIEFDLHR